MGQAYLTTDELQALKANISFSSAQLSQAATLILSLSAELRLMAEKRGIDLDDAAHYATGTEDEGATDYALVLKSVIADIVTREVVSDSTADLMSQVTQSGLGYSFTGTYANTGGGVYIKRSELRRLGLSGQFFSVVDISGARLGGMPWGRPYGSGGR